MVPIESFTDDKYLYCILPYCDGGDLQHWVNEEQGRFSEEEACSVFRQILYGLDTLQQAGICHRNIDMENILTTMDGRVVICGLKHAFKIPYMNMDGMDDDYSNHRERQRYLIRPFRNPHGTLRFMAHELLMYHQFDGHAVDLWATSLLLFAMCGCYPWNAADLVVETFRQSSSGNFARIASFNGCELSDELLDLLQNMFFLNPRDRLSLEQIRVHPWMQRYSTRLG